jgi:TonB family protein
MAWKQWEGQVVDGEFHLRRYLGGCEHSAVFLTGCGEREPRKAAIKLVLVERENAELQLSQWKQAAKLSHAHLIRLFRMGRWQLSNVGVLYVVMEYAEEDLSQVLAHRPLTEAEAREMLGPVLDTLAYVHGKGFVHGRLKPANILAVDDQLKLSSEGVCRVGESRAGPGKPGVYDPPEITGAGSSPAGDVWSLGVTLTEALTLRLPVWEGADQEDLVLPETLPAPFLDIARRCLRRDPRRRWTVADIAARLQQSPPGLQEPTTAGPRKTLVRWRYAVPVTALGLALAAILAGPRLLHRRPEPQRGSAIPSERPRVQPEPQRESRPEVGAQTAARGFVPGEVVRQVLPEVPRKASNSIQGKVRLSVRVRVDPSGSVVSAELESPGPSKYFAELALRAARLWKFEPAKVDGQAVSSEWILRFEFVRTATKVFPVRAAR